VGHEENGHVRLVANPDEVLVEEVASDGVHCPERLVHEEHLAVLSEGACERDPLAHAAGQLMGSVLGKAVEADQFEQLTDLPGALAAAPAAQSHQHADVLLNCQPREERRLLEHQGGVAGGDGDRAAGGDFQAYDQVQDG
jgi:hypothetical protein